MDELRIKPSKKKWLKKMALSFLGILFGGFILLGLPKYFKAIPSWVLIGLGTVIMGYNIMLILMTRNVLSKKNEGLIFNKKGIFDFSSIIAFGEIPWKSVTEIKIEKTKNPNIIVTVKKPQKWIDQAKNGAIKSLREKNLRDFGSPVVFESKFYEIDWEELRSFIGERGVSVEEI